jgi:putative transposase
MQRRKFSREFKLEAVRLVRERGVAVAQAARDLDVHENVLRKWVKEFAADPGHAFPEHGQMKPEQLEIDRLRREVAKLKAERDILKKPPPTSRRTRYEVCLHREAPRDWPVAWMCGALGVSRSGFHAWLTRAPSKRARDDEMIGARVRASHVGSYRTYGARRVWHDLLAEGISCGLHRVERLMQAHGLRARPRRRGLPKDQGERSVIAGNVLDRQFTADRPNQKWVADFTYIWTAEGWPMWPP